MSRTLVIRLSRRSSPWAPVIPASLVNARDRILRTDWARFKAESGFWNTIWIARRAACGRFLVEPCSASPSRTTRLPGSGAWTPRIVLAIVVLPDPDSPTRPRVSPW